jgi:hypothetical protein
MTKYLQTPSWCLTAFVQEEYESYLGSEEVYFVAYYRDLWVTNSYSMYRD